MGPAGAAATGAVGAIVGGTSGIITGFFSPSVIELLDDEIGCIQALCTIQLRSKRWELKCHHERAERPKQGNSLDT